MCNYTIHISSQIALSTLPTIIINRDVQRLLELKDTIRDVRWLLCPDSRSRKRCKKLAFRDITVVLDKRPCLGCDCMHSDGEHISQTEFLISLGIQAGIQAVKGVRTFVAKKKEKRVLAKEEKERELLEAGGFVVVEEVEKESMRGKKTRYTDCKG